jgi:hypothetical protein
MKTEEPLCLNKKQLVKRLGFACDHTINDLIKRGVIPPPLPGSRFFYLPAVIAALEKASAVKTGKEARS